nr:tRNA (adenosine(37)-N6)-dimethylallyltransferase MiaA [Gellertiella hungarica]
MITGPTASGKSQHALEWARKTGGAVVNADSMQVYDTLRVLTARPSEEEMEGIDHLLYGHVPASRAYSTGAWLRDMEAVLARLRSEGRMPVIVGGTGLYFKALTEGLSEMPAIPPAVRERVRARLEALGPEALHAELADIDSPAAERIGRQDGQRIARAIEVFEASGQTLTGLQRASAPPLVDPARALKMVILPDRAILADRINRRFERMLAGEAIAEVEALLRLSLPDTLPVMRAIGVPEIREHLAGRLGFDAVRERGAAATRQYAKRQMTWFRNQMDDGWERISAAQ